jgi:hypothetical protein
MSANKRLLSRKSFLGIQSISQYLLTLLHEFLLDIRYRITCSSVALHMYTYGDSR